jgi:TolB-like protein/Flp pilus assembly protein TadD
LPGPDIFLSYNREDAATAKLFADAFIRDGLEVWWDQALRSGEAYDEVTENALQQAKAVVVLWSPRSVVSRWVRAEATTADRNRTLLPAMIETCNLPVMFQLTQTADLSGWRGDVGDASWMAFLGDVRRFVGHDGSRVNLANSAPVPNVGAGAPSFVAVLPLTHRAANGELEVLAEDLTEDITRQLASNRWFKVIAASTMAGWRGRRADYAALATETKARYLLESKLQDIGEDLRLTIQIVESDTASVVFSQQFIGKGKGAFAAENLSRAAASQLAERIVELEFNRCIAKQDQLSGWEHLLRAGGLALRGGPGEKIKAVDEARKAVALSPDLGLAHSHLAAILAAGNTSLGKGHLDEATKREMHDHIKQALLLDGDNPEILISLVNSYAVLGDCDAALRLARRATDTETPSSRALSALGRAHHMMGQASEAIAVFSRQLDVTQGSTERAIALHMLGICLCIEARVSEAEKAIDQSLTAAPHFSPALVMKAVTAALQRQERLARSTVMQLREAEPSASCEQLLGHITTYPMLYSRASDIVATFRRLWIETGGDG